MSKLIFTYGTMGSAKTANALMKYYELKVQGKNALLLKPSVDNRDGISTIKSRVGLSAEALVFTSQNDLRELVKNKTDCIIVDEAQFSNAHHVDEMKKIAIYMNIAVYAYGLKTNFQSELFEGSKRLIELADELRVLEMTCVQCGNPAEINARFGSNGRIVKDGNVVDLGGNEKYKALCYKCWNDEINEK